ncbi:T9SS type A sorting domain-containing protein [candidate division WOR-3 bacterium]|nr:T9SS type A sorting domain-containing protein [candidate division WOR-3 bacterium]
MKYTLFFLILISSAFALNYHGCTLAPDNVHGWIVVINPPLILHTTDGGATWESQSLPDTATRKLFDITCVDQFSAWITGWHGLHAAEILHTDNGGLDWYRQVAGFSKYGTRIEFIDEDHGWSTGGDGAIAATTDGGGYWEQILTDWYAAEYYGVSFVNQWDGWIVAGWPDSLATGQGYIVPSTDGGITWDTVNGYHTSGYEDFFDVHFFNVLDGVVVGGDEADTSAIILKTTDGGSTWPTVSAPANSYYLRAVDFVGDEGWAVGRFGTIIHTTNGGNSWASQTSPATTTLFDVDFTDNLHGIACGYDIVLLTTDGGQNWHESPGIEEHQNTEVETTNLSVYPNPFRQMINIKLQIPRTKFQTNSKSQIALKIYDVSGKIVKVFNLQSEICNLQSIKWSGTDQLNRPVPHGVYFVKLETPMQVKTEKVILMK